MGFSIFLGGVFVVKEKILDAAIHEFTKQGFRFTMNDVAKDLGMSKKTIYTVFSSKEALLEGIADKYFADFLIMQKIIKNSDMDVIVKIKTILCALPERYQNIGLSNLYGLRDKYPRIYERLLEYMTEGWNQVEQYLNQGMKEGRIREVSIPVLMAMIKGTVEQFMKSRVLIENSIAYEEAKKEMIEIITKGIQQ